MCIFGGRNVHQTKQRSIVPAHKPEIWLLSAYSSASHAGWVEWMVGSHPEVQWRRFELPGRNFKWRIRGNPLSWLDALPEGAPDLLLATSMVDLATIKGLHPRLSGVPAWYYFHENQIVYPKSVWQMHGYEPQMVQLYAALAADRLFFNSEFNRSTFLQGVQDFLKPRDVDEAAVRTRMQAKSRLLPIPISPIKPAEAKDPRLIVWNHRWEYDKAPDVFADAVLRLAERGVDFRLALLGNRFGKNHEALDRLREQVPERIVTDEELDRPAYRDMLAKASIAVSTAIHEFQGLAMLEAASAGARPLVPDHLCYPEQYADIYRYTPGDAGALAGRLEQWLEGELPPPADVSPWYCDELNDRWRRLFNDGR